MAGYRRIFWKEDGNRMVIGLFDAETATNKNIFRYVLQDINKKKAEKLYEDLGKFLGKEEA